MKMGAGMLRRLLVWGSTLAILNSFGINPAMANSNSENLMKVLGNENKRKAQRLVIPEPTRFHWDMVADYNENPKFEKGLAKDVNCYPKYDNNKHDTYVIFDIKDNKLVEKNHYSLLNCDETYDKKLEYAQRMIRLGNKKLGADYLKNNGFKIFTKFEDGSIEETESITHFYANGNKNLNEVLAKNQLNPKGRNLPATNEKVIMIAVPNDQLGSSLQAQIKENKKKEESNSIVEDTLRFYDGTIDEKNFLLERKYVEGKNKSDLLKIIVKHMGAASEIQNNIDKRDKSDNKTYIDAMIKGQSFIGNKKFVNNAQGPDHYSTIENGKNETILITLNDPNFNKKKSKQKIDREVNSTNPLRKQFFGNKSIEEIIEEDSLNNFRKLKYVFPDYNVGDEILAIGYDKNFRNKYEIRVDIHDSEKFAVTRKSNPFDHGQILYPNAQKILEGETVSEYIISNFVFNEVFSSLNNEIDGTVDVFTKNDFKVKNFYTKLADNKSENYSGDDVFSPKDFVEFGAKLAVYNHFKGTFTNNVENGEVNFRKVEERNLDEELKRNFGTKGLKKAILYGNPIPYLHTLVRSNVGWSEFSPSKEMEKFENKLISQYNGKVLCNTDDLTKFGGGQKAIDVKNSYQLVMEGYNEMGTFLSKGGY